MITQSIQSIQSQFVNQPKFAKLANAVPPSQPSSSSRAGQRRLRAENSYYSTASTGNLPWAPPSQTRLFALQELGFKIAAAMEERNFEKAIANLELFQQLITLTLLELEEPWMLSAIHGVIVELKAYCAAMENRPQEALQKHQEALDKLSTFFQIMADELLGSIFSNIFTTHLSFHKGLYLLLNGEQEKGIAELQKMGDTEEIPLILMLSSLEKRLGVQILQPKALLSPSVDETELFLAGRYEEALQILDKGMDSDTSFWVEEEGVKIACYAMLGRYEEALALCKESTHYDAQMESLIVQFMKGDYEEAKKTPHLEGEAVLFYAFYLIPLNLAIKFSEKN